MADQNGCIEESGCGKEESPALPSSFFWRRVDSSTGPLLAWVQETDIELTLADIAQERTAPVTSVCTGPHKSLVYRPQTSLGRNVLSFIICKGTKILSAAQKLVIKIKVNTVLVFHAHTYTQPLWQRTLLIHF